MYNGENRYDSGCQETRQIATNIAAPLLHFVELMFHYETIDPQKYYHLSTEKLNMRLNQMVQVQKNRETLEDAQTK